MEITKCLSAVLQDVLENDDIKMDTLFKMSLIYDLVNVSSRIVCHESYCSILLRREEKVISLITEQHMIVRPVVIISLFFNSTKQGKLTRMKQLIVAFKYVIRNEEAETSTAAFQKSSLTEIRETL